MKGSAERQFERFRLSGSPRALGAVYDELAPELLRLAQRLAGDPILAEDLVQLTFLTAIERAASFRKGAPLAPWLLGILAQHAKVERRRGARRPDPLRLNLRKELSPDCHAELEELDGRVDAALAALPEAQRSVLILRLRHGLSAPEIADALGRPPGTVRSQLARGLDRVRELLPAGLTTTGMLAFGLPRGLDAMRAVVVGKAAVAAPPLLVAAQGTLLWSFASLAEILVMKKLGVAAIALIASVFGLRAVLDGAEPGPSAGVPAVSTPSVAVDDPAPERASKVASADSQAARSAGVPPARVPTEAEPEAGVENALGSGALQVRVLHALGDAVPDEVCVLTLPSESPASATTWSAATGDDGSVRFDDLPEGDLELRLLRGQQRSVRIRAGKTTHVELKLDEGIEVQGLVIDGFGEPVGGAEIWLSERWQARRGFTVAFTDPVGRFRLRDVHADNYVGALAPGYGISYVQAPSAQSGEHDELRIVLDTKGSRVEVEVVDAEGLPISGAQVLVGFEESKRYRLLTDGTTTPPPPPRRGTTDERGIVTLGSIPVGETEVQARARGLGAARVEAVVLADQLSRVRVVLLPAARVVGHVQDEAGAPVPRAEVWVGARFQFASVRARTDEEGRFALDGAGAGPRVLTAEKKGLGDVLRELELTAGETEKVVLEIVSKPTIHGVLLGADGAPVHQYTLVAREGETRRQVSYSVTNADGRFRLDVEEGQVYSVLVRRPGDWRGFPLLVETGLRASPQSRELRIPREGVDTASVRLTALAPDGSPVSEAKLSLWHHELEIWRTLPATSEQGELELNGLAPGTLQLSLRHEVHPMKRLGDFTLVAGQVLDLGQVAFDPSGSLSATLIGSDDQSLRDSLQIFVGRPGGENGVVERNEAGFHCQSLAPGDWLISVVGDFVVPIYRTVTIEAGVTSETEPKIERSGLCRLVLHVRKDEDPPRWVGGQAWDASGRLAWSGSSQPLEGGEFEARVSVLPGSYRFEGRDDQGRVARTDFDVVSLGVEAPGQRVLLQ